MSNVIHANFGKPKVESGYGYKKISEEGVNLLTEAFSHTSYFTDYGRSASPSEMETLLRMISEVLSVHITDKHLMTKGDPRI